MNVIFEVGALIMLIFIDLGSFHLKIHLHSDSLSHLQNFSAWSLVKSFSNICFNYFSACLDLLKKAKSSLWKNNCIGNLESKSKTKRRRSIHYKNTYLFYSHFNIEQQEEKLSQHIYISGATLILVE